MIHCDWIENEIKCYFDPKVRIPSIGISDSKTPNLEFSRTKRRQKFFHQNCCHDNENLVIYDPLILLPTPNFSSKNASLFPLCLILDSFK